MAGGSKSKSTSTQQSTSGSAQAWANPYAKQAVQDVMASYNANKPAMEQNIAKANALTDQLTSGWQSAKGNTAAANSKANGGVGYTSDVLGGKYLTGNPYLDDIIAKTAGDVTNQANSQFTLAGRYGSGAHTDVLSQNLADMEAQARFNNYEAERAHMDTAAGLRSSEQQAAAARAAEAERSAAALAIQQQQAAAQLPYTDMNNLANALGQLFNGGQSTGSSTSTTSTSPNILGGLAAGASAAGGLGWAPFAASDPRVKHNIELLYREPDGLGWYEYSYLGSDERETGVLANEVAELRPWALGPEIDGGIRTVVYDRLDWREAA